MKKCLILIPIFLLATLSSAQELQWAFRLLDYSSERTEEEYAAKNIVGDPFQYGGKKSWQPKSAKKEEFIKVGFLTPKTAKQVIVTGVFDPAQLQSVSVFDAGGKEFMLPCSIQGEQHIGYKQLVFPIEDDYLYILAVKVRLKPSLANAAIHGIGISDSKEIVQHTVPYTEFIDAHATLVKVENTVNTSFTEFGPLLSPDGNTLYFSRKHDAKNMGGEKDEEDIWFANWDADAKQWKEAQNFGGPFNTEGPNFINSFTPDGNTMLLGNSYKENGKLDGGVSISRHTEQGWSFPERIYIEDERNSNEKANYFLSNDETILLLSVERKGDTQGDRDLYVSFPQKDSTWSKPKSLGHIVNTIGTEAAPFLSEDGTMLFFASNGLSGYGGSDIYMVERLDDTWEHWSAPQNLGPLVNTPYDESFFTISTPKNQIYFTSVGKEKVDMDIYRLDLPIMASH